MINRLNRINRPAIGVPFGGGGQSIPAPFSSDMLFFLNGEIELSGSDYYFVDKTSNGRNFLITGYDFDSTWTAGLPYKTAATISAPAGDAILIAADINNFLYDSGGTPNQIPVVSLFQDIDYEHKIFCRHAAQQVDAITGEETYEARVLDITMYSTVKSGADLTTCQTYFSVPAESGTAYWVSKTGNDTNDGSKASPWLTLTKCNDAGGRTVYVKTGIYVENGSQANFYMAQSGDIKGLGLCEVRQTASSSVIYAVGTGAKILTGLIFNAGGAGADYVVRFFNNVSNIKFNRCKFYGADTRDFNISSAPNGVHEFNNCIINTVSTYGFYIGSNVTINGCHINSSGTYGIYTGALTAAGNFVFNYNKVISSCATGFAYLFQLDQFNLDINYNKFSISKGYGFSTSNQKELSFLYNIFKVTGTGGTPLYYVKTDATTPITNAKANYNYINSVNETGYGIHIGADGGTIGAWNDTIANIEVIGNTLLGAIYNDPSKLGSTTHGILVGFHKNSIIKYNYVNGYGIGIIKKHGGVADTAGVVFYNLIVNCVQGIYSKGAAGVLVYNNTIYNDLITNLKAIRLSENLGGDGAINCVFRNNIVYNTHALGATDGLLSFDAASLAGLDSDYNSLYSTSGFVYNGTTAFTDLADWQDELQDLHSIATNPILINYIPVNPIVGLSLDAVYDDGLDASTDWGNDNTTPTIVTKQQGATWDIGAYVH